MAQSSEIKSQIDALLGQINPLLEQLPNAEDYFQKRVNEAYNYNLGPLTNAANIEAKMYSLPGTLMSQYDQEFGGKTGVSANQRINSILGQLGQQGALANTAWGLADQSKTRINDLANSLYNQYKASIEAYQQKLAPLLSIWERMYSEENANKRAQMSRGGSSYGGRNWGDITIVDDTSNTESDTKPTSSTLSPGNALSLVGGLGGSGLPLNSLQPEVGGGGVTQIIPSANSLVPNGNVLSGRGVVNMSRSNHILPNSLY